MHSFSIIFKIVLILGIISVGCKTGHPDSTEYEENINQVDSSGRKQGPWKIYADTVLIAKGSYFDGKPEGLWRYWYDNGQMKEEGNYRNGEKNGVWVEWYLDGAMMWKGEWENGTRQIGYLGAKAELTFVGQDLKENILTHEHTYRLRIRILNIPVSHLFVEVNNGSILREGESDLFILSTPSDTILKMAIGYIPDLEFRDFRNLVKEINFNIR